LIPSQRKESFTIQFESLEPIVVPMVSQEVLVKTSLLVDVADKDEER